MSKIRQSVLPFKLEKGLPSETLTSFAGLPLVHEMFRALGLPRSIAKQVRLKQAGYPEAELIEELVSLSIAGGEHLEDIALLQADRGLQRLIGKEKIPSAKTFERFLKLFHQDFTGPLPEGAFVAPESQALTGLAEVNRKLIRKLIEASKLSTVTIENDATLVESHKEKALMTYKGYAGYQPVLGVVAELGLVLADEFREGNVPAAYRVKDFFARCLSALPKSVTTLHFRGDGAYYDHALLAYLKKRRIGFTVTAKKSASILEWIEARPESDWQDLYVETPQGPRKTDRQLLELHWTAAQGSREEMHDRTLRYVVTRKSQTQWELFQKDHALQEVERSERYEVIATNFKDQKPEVIAAWHQKRGGSIEHVHDRIKNDLAGGHLPCAEFGANAAWWRIQCLAWNLVRALQLHALPKEEKQLQVCHLKRLRMHLFALAGRVVEHARRLILRLSHDHPSFEMYREARQNIARLSFG